MEVRKAEISMGDFIKSDLERVIEEWRKIATDRRYWKMRGRNKRQ